MNEKDARTLLSQKDLYALMILERVQSNSKNAKRNKKDLMGHGINFFAGLTYFFLWLELFSAFALSAFVLIALTDSVAQKTNKPRKSKLIKIIKVLPKKLSLIKNFPKCL